MTSSLSSILNDTFINRFAGLASGSSDPAKALTQGKPSGAATIQNGLRLGARTFATGVQNLNSLISVVNVAESTLGALGKITDKLIDLAKQATASDVGSQKRQELDIEYRRLGNQFSQIIDKAKVGDSEILSVDGLAAIFTNVGLDKESSNGIAQFFESFVLPEVQRTDFGTNSDSEDDNEVTSQKDDLLASDQIKGPQPLRIPSGAFNVPVVVSRVTKDYDHLFDGSADIRTRPNAYKVLNDLNGLKDQIDKNVQNLSDGRELIGKNIDLVRAAGFAFLDLSDQITSDGDAATIAEDLRQRIRKDAPAALSQAENLESIVVAALALNSASDSQK